MARNLIKISRESLLQIPGNGNVKILQFPGNFRPKKHSLLQGTNYINREMMMGEKKSINQNGIFLLFLWYCENFWQT